MVLAHQNWEYEGLLYPLMVIAAVAVVVFSLLGIATMRGWLPHALVSAEVVELSATKAVPADSAPVAAFGCAECGVIESMNRAADKPSN